MNAKNIFQRHPSLAPYSGRPGAACSEHGEWILLLDDDVSAGRALARWVRQVTGLDVQVARTIQQAQNCMTSLPEPTAILTDFELQNAETGALALARLRAQGCRAPAVVVTGAPELALCALAESTLDEVIPVFSRSELHERVGDWLEQLQLCWVPSRRASA